MLVELLLQTLIGIVDAKLLKGVFRKRFEAINVENCNDLSTQALFCCQAQIDAVHNV